MTKLHKGIIARYRRGDSLKNIAADHGVSIQYISKLCNDLGLRRRKVRTVKT